MSANKSEIKTGRGRDTLDRLVRLSNAITEACREVQKCPDDSIQDIFNESLCDWETGLWMDHNFNLEPNEEVNRDSRLD